jgi:rhodanese-related sulfurtransferase
MVILTASALCILFLLLLSLLFLFARLSVHIQCFNANEFEKQLTATKDGQLIDVCTPREFEKQHIPHAININYRRPDFCAEIEKLDKTKPVFIYCLSGVRSKLTAFVCKKAGFKNIYELNMGLKAWLKTGKPIAKKDNQFCNV